MVRATSMSAGFAEYARMKEVSTPGEKAQVGAAPAPAPRARRASKLLWCLAL